MDGFIDFIIFAAFIGLCIFFDKFGNAMKKTQKQPETGPVRMEIPTMQQPHQQPQPQRTVRKTTKGAGTKNWHNREDLSKRREFQNEGIRSTENFIQPLEIQQRSEYAFDSIDDVRKAIIWSEILNKKY